MQLQFLMWLIFLCIILVILIGWIASYFFKAKIKKEFTLKPFLTSNEMEFLDRLELAVPELRFHAQVSMGALLDVVLTEENKHINKYALRAKFSQKIVDFVAQSRDTGQVIAIIELDDKTHDIEKDKLRDAMLNQAGYSVIRWQSKSKPTPNAIRKVLLGLMK